MTDTAQPKPAHNVLDVDGRLIPLDDEGFFMDDQDWDEDACRVLAAQSGLTEITEAHWRVLYGYREYYARNGRAPLNRDLKAATGMSVLEMERLFPGGLKLGARRLCGLPNPKTCQ